jgi:FlaA1/EpsC-like NDP-sugar epimerase
VNIDALLGRNQRGTDPFLPDRSYLRDRRVMVTGAGGSIGSELCRQILWAGPAELVMVDRDESALHAVQLSLYGRALLDDRGVVLADIRDNPRVNEILDGYRPEILFHAAALKHQPLLEQYPGEAVKTNIWGTWNVLSSSAAYGVKVLVNISTDKAADPSCVLGYSKRITERLTSWWAPRRYVSVRFGNVLGSRGSVLETFQEQIRVGRSITITHPDVTRYFMTVQEAVSLTLHAAAIGEPGQALVLDMGEPVRIVDLATRLGGADIPIVYTGLRPGEKLTETLLGPDEKDIRPHHHLITQVDVPPLNPTYTARIDPDGDRQTIIRRIARTCTADNPTPQPVKGLRRR